MAGVAKTPSRATRGVPNAATRCRLVLEFVSQHRLLRSTQHEVLNVGARQIFTIVFEVQKKKVLIVSRSICLGQQHG